MVYYNSLIDEVSSEAIHRRQTWKLPNEKSLETPMCFMVLIPEYSSKGETVRIGKWMDVC